MYSVLSYGVMAAEGVRMDAYARAIAATVRPGSVVLDLGCGSGVLSLLALRSGARRVHAIDIDPAVWLARDLAAENGLGERLVVHHKSSFDLELEPEERADVIVGDLRGSCPLFQQNLAVMEDARRRLLAPGGVLIPAQDRLFVALVESTPLWHGLEDGWMGVQRQGFQAGAARTATLNTQYTDAIATIYASQLLSEPKPWASIHYGEQHAHSISANVELSMKRGGTAHALALWFEASVHGDIAFTNAPGNQLVYARTVLPLLEPVTVGVADLAHVTLRTDVTGSQWAWDTVIGERARFRQASFLGLPTSPAALLRESINATPARSDAGDRAARVLSLMDGTRTVREIVDEIAASEPGARREVILDDVKKCARHYGR